MSKRVFRFAATATIGLMLMIAGMVSSLLTRSISSTPAQAMSSGHELVNEIAGYRNWTRVNPQPVLMRAASALDCAAPTPPIPHPPGVNNPHADKFITVYVNDLGKKAMLEMRKPEFPQGSVIVKEKLTNQSSSEPELLTVMMLSWGWMFIIALVSIGVYLVSGDPTGPRASGSHSPGLPEKRSQTSHNKSARAWRAGSAQRRPA
jgi:hypothetical protein